jgi:hypothetical protein
MKTVLLEYDGSEEAKKVCEPQSRDEPVSVEEPKEEAQRKSKRPYLKK